MAYHHHAGDSAGGANAGGEYSGDERDSRSGGEERSDLDLHEKPTYLLEHLATFTVNKESGIVYPADGMRRLLQLEKTTGIWSQKMQLCLDYQWVLIMDYETGNIIERFPASLIQEPTAFTSADAMDLYNNILVFIVSAGGSGARSEMHIFQSQSVSAGHLVEDLKNLRSGKLVMQQRESLPAQALKSQVASGVGASAESNKLTRAMLSRSEHQQQQQQQQQHHLHHHHQQQQSQVHYSEGGRLSEAYGGGASSGGPGPVETDCDPGGLNDETSSTSSDKYERDVTVLNHCFDDIEKFIARLQHMAAASRELERRRRNRKTKKKDLGEGLLTLRTRPPHEKEFIDIFAKFKLSFNLLAKLKAHIHDPNAPELVHFLFTPLALIVEAASDHYFDAQLPARVINPLLTREAINLLINCVTSKETELWRSLGEAWVIPRDQWKDDVGSYHPVFLDGWSPDYLVIDELETTTPSTPTNMGKHRRHEQGGSGHRESHSHSQAVVEVMRGGSDDLHYGRSSHPELMSETDGGGGGGGGAGAAAADYGIRSDIGYDSIDRRAPSGGASGPLNNGVMQAIASGMQNLHTRDPPRISTATGGGELDRRNVNDEQLVEAWLEELQAAGAKIVLVTYPRTANNDKELSVVRGEYLEILDDTRKWWKARNIRGQVAHVPHTIVTLYNYADYGPQSTSPQQQQQNSGGYKPSTRHAVNDIMEERGGGGAGNSDWVRNKHLGKKGEFRYF